MKTTTLSLALLCSVLCAESHAAKVIPNHAIANLVLGQDNFTTGSFVSPYTSFRMSGPFSVIVDPVTRKVFVGDSNGDRILRFASADSLTNGAPAEAVFGASSFSDEAGGSTQTKFFDPSCLFLDRYGRLWVADPGNNRVLCFEAAAYRSDSPSADLVFGQPDFTTVTSGTTASKMRSPYGVCVDADDNLWVAEYSNNRVLKFASISTKSSGAAADSVLGQAIFTTSGAGSGNTGLQGPVSVSVSASGTLYVACYDSNRIMRFNNAATLGSNPPASGVLGQPDFATTSSGLAANKLDNPEGCFITPDDSLWVTDYANNRLLRFSNASTKGAGSNADGVVGQPNFTTNTSATTSQGLTVPLYAPFVDATGSLWIADSGNNRVLRYGPDLTKPLLTLTKPPKTTSKNQLQIKGGASDTYGISAVRYQVNGGAWKTANGTTSWKFIAKLKKGLNKVKIYSVDSVGNQSVKKVVKITKN